LQFLKSGIVQRHTPLPSSTAPLHNTLITLA
jgi:hypothetical protein